MLEETVDIGKLLEKNDTNKIKYYEDKLNKVNLKYELCKKTSDDHYKLYNKYNSKSCYYGSKATMLRRKIEDITS